MRAYKVEQLWKHIPATQPDKFPVSEAAETNFQLGTVIEAWPYWHVYLISRSHGRPILATALSGTEAPGGAKSLSTYVPGQLVLFYRPEDGGGSPAYIIGGVPDKVGKIAENSPARLLEDGIFPHLDIESDELRGRIKGFDIAAYNMGRALDAMPGDTGVLNALGVGYKVGLITYVMQASGLAKIEASYLDNLLKLIGHNYRLSTGTREEYSGAYGGECGEVVRYGLYPWELMGRFAKDSGLTKLDNKLYDGDVSTDSDNLPPTDPEERIACKPVEIDQQPIYRLHAFRGYLGDLERIIVSAPPEDGSNVERYSVPTDHMGLSETVRHLDGRLEFRSTKGILLEKTVFIPVPKQQVEHDDPAGDVGADSGYKISGAFGEGKSHNKLEFTEQDTGTFGADTFERVAQTHQQGSQSLARHTKDWHLPTEKEPTLESNALRPAKTSQYSPDLTAEQHTIDAARGVEVRYFNTRAMVYIEDDGSILIEDGRGSQVVLHGGSIDVTCPNDVNIRPGRNANILAPNDLILRAGNSVDISAGNEDVRIKAQRNFQVLAGNDRDQEGNETDMGGGIILESRSGMPLTAVDAVGTDVRGAGIVLKSAGTTAVLGQTVYVRAGSEGEPGAIYLDATSGQGDIYAFSRNTYNLVAQQVLTLYGATPLSLEPRAYEAHNAQLVYMGQTEQVVVAGNSFIHGGSVAEFNGSVASKDGGELATIDTGQLTNSLGEQAQSVQRLANTISSAITASTAPYGDDSYGWQTTIDTLGFSFRIEPQYRIEGYTFWESRWQQYFRLFELQTEVWMEPPVYDNATGQLTGPFPGYQRSTEDGSFKILGENIYWDKDKGEVPLDPETETTEAELPQAVDKKLSTGYLVNLQA